PWTGLIEPAQNPIGPVSILRSNGLKGDLGWDYYSSARLKYQLGDLIYGLNEYRTPTVKALESALNSSLNPAVTIDSFNDQLFAFLVNPSDQQTDTRSVLEFTAEAQKRFHGYLNYLKRHPDFSPSTRRQGRGDPEDIAIKRACKAAIGFTLSQGNTIHFILDGLDEQAATGLGNSSRPYASFTNAELRFLFKTQLGNPEILNQVRFYRKGEVLELPPWMEDSETLNELWQQYKDEKS
ncbi:MAG: hypothetical protein ACO3A2_04970, partial [Bdellovibrionia bacterium]